MFGSSMGDKQDVTVWVRVQVGGAISGGLLKVTVASDIDVATFKEKVQEKYKTSFIIEVAAGWMEVS
jgi:hypothetical protein